ncbi:MAG TPA: type II secretion system F family protein [Jiangellaceae bacterium]
MSTVAAVVCAALAGAVLAGRPPLLRTRLGRPAAGVGSPASAPALQMGARSGVLQRLRARVAARRSSDERESDIAEICLALSAELRSGVPMGRAVTAVAADWPDLLGDVAGQVAIGGDVAAALRRAGTAPGAGALTALAAAWDVAERTGAPLSRVLLAVADSLRMAAGARREAQSQLATVRTTARLMAILPFGTLLMLSGGDQAAVRFLVATPVGWMCLGVAGALVGLGLWWVSRVSRSVTGTAWTV